MRKGNVLLADSHQNMLSGVRNLPENIVEKVFMVADETSLMEAAEKLRNFLVFGRITC